MTHEVKQLFEHAYHWQSLGLKSVLITVVALEGSSYRRPGVRMLLNETGQSVGAVSGGCVEKEVKRQAQSVFLTSVSKIITYDGRLRLGCEGILYLLIEPLEITSEFYDQFLRILLDRRTFQIYSFYKLKVGEDLLLGSYCEIDKKLYPFNANLEVNPKEEFLCFKQDLAPLFQLYILGAEHDAVQLCKAASLLGWEVTIIADPDEQKTIEFFPGAAHFLTPLISEFEFSIDAQTAVILMTHSFNKDLQYLTKLSHTKLAYLGILGPNSRRERLFNLLMEYQPNISYDFLEQIYAPAGLNIGAESPSEISISVLGEILSVVRQKEPIPLREKSGKIHG